MADDMTLIKSEMSAMMLWKLGLGNMAKYFNGEDPMPNKDKRPTKEMIRNCKPMPTDPEDYSDIKDVPIVVPKWAMDIIKKGHIPEAQEDHWFMYCTHDAFRYYRSWSGMCAYDCHFRRLDNDLYLIDRITVNRDLAQFGVNGEFAAILLLHYLLAAETGCDWRPAWDAFCDLRYAFVKNEDTVVDKEETNEETEDDNRKRPTGLDLKDKIRGCLIGGAVGDALGYGIEFMKWHEIEKQYGKMGIRRYNDHGAKRFCGVARISDDTQMTLFTAGGLINGLTECIFEGKRPEEAYHHVADAYIDWLHTQSRHGKRKEPHCWFTNMAFMNEQRAPGNTCLTALKEIEDGCSVKNNSKGCGGVMRTAPVALFFAGLRDKGVECSYLREEAAIAAKLAWLTHRHPLGWLPSFAFNMMLTILLDGGDMQDAVKSSISFMEDFIYQDWTRDVDIKVKDQSAYLDEAWKLINLLKLACKLGDENVSKAEAYKQLGEGWVAEETLAIAVYCAIRFSNPKNIRTKYPEPDKYSAGLEQRQHMFEEAICCAVNHSGDSDSTGAICGQLMGTWLGLHSIPGYYTGNMFCKDPLFEGREENCDLEGRHLLMAIADDLADGCPFEREPYPLEITDKKQKMWYLRYILHVDCDSTNVEELWKQIIGR